MRKTKKLLPTIEFYGVEFPLCPATNEELVAQGYQLINDNPHYQEDDTKYNARQKALLFLRNSHLIINGDTGTGKDEIIMRLAYLTKLPIRIFNFGTEADSTGWIKRLSLKKEEGVTQTVLEDGSLKKSSRGLKIHRDLSKLDPDGDDLSVEEIQQLISEMESFNWQVTNIIDNVYEILIPSLNLFSDFDRAGHLKTEAIRQAVEKGKEHLTDPITGEMFPVLHGTRFIFTSNSGVDGDNNRGMVTKIKDASIQNRMCAVTFDHPSEDFEVKIYSAKFPQLLSTQVLQVVQATRALREIVRAEYIPMDVSIRNGIAWIEHSIMFMEFYGCSWEKALKESFDSITGHFMTPENKALFTSGISTFITSHASASAEEKPPFDIPF